MKTKWLSKIAILLIVGLLSFIPVMLVLAAPSTVAETTNTDTGDYPFQRKVGYANGYYHVFYTDNATNLLHRSSVDGVTWGASDVAVAGQTDQGNASVWFDVNDVHIVGWVAGDIVYRKGTCAADGTITWAAAVQTAVAGGGTNPRPTVTVGTDDIPVIGYRFSNAGTLEARVVKADAADGTFVAAAGYPLVLTAVNGAYGVSVVPISGNDILATYAVAADTMKARPLYSDNTSLGAVETISTTNCTDGIRFSVINDGATKIFAVMYGADSKTYYYIRTTATGIWSAEADSGKVFAFPAISYDSTNQLALMSNQNGATAQYTFYYNGAWGATQTWASDTPTSGISLSQNFQYLSGVYGTHPANYNVQHVRLTQPVVTTDNVSYLIDKDGLLSGNFGFTLSDNGTAPALTNAVGWGSSDNTAPYVYTRTAYASDNTSTLGYKQSAFTLAAQVPSTTYYYRGMADFRGVGLESSFTIAPPTTTTFAGSNSADTLTLNGNITSLGDASTVSAYFEYGLTTAYGSTTALVTENATGAYSASITHPDYPKNIHYRSVVLVGTAKYYGSDMTLTTSTAAKDFNLDTILQVVPLLVFVLVVLGAGVLAVFGWKQGNMVVVILGFVFIAVLIIMYPIIIAGIEGVLAFIP